MLTCRSPSPDPASKFSLRSSSSSNLQPRRSARLRPGTTRDQPITPAKPRHYVNLSDSEPMTIRTGPQAQAGAAGPLRSTFNLSTASRTATIMATAKPEGAPKPFYA